MPVLWNPKVIIMFATAARPYLELAEFIHTFMLCVFNPLKPKLV
jgi:hypothetical protein